MLGNNKNTTISKNVAHENELDFAYLRKLGVSYLEQFSGKLWTDFNSHDPGITLLELLSYAITDLGARIHAPIEDILTVENGSGHRQFFEAFDILPSHPVTATDYRKLFIDVQGVKNAWIMPFEKRVYINCDNNQLSYDPFTDFPEHKYKCFKIKGLNKILIDYDSFDSEKFKTDTAINKEKARIQNKVRCIYHANRNLCEDLVEIKEVPVQKVGVCMQVELFPETDEELVLAKIKYAIEAYFSPKLKFHTLQEMIEDGVPTETIFEGPRLQHGFIKDKDLQKADLRKEVRLSDLINLISEIHGVKLILDISMNTCGEDEQPGSDEWRMCIKPGHKPELCDNSIFSFFKDVLPVNINEKVVEAYLQEMHIEDFQEELDLKASLKTLTLKKGQYADFSAYSSVVHDLPLVYGVGEVGLPKIASEARKSQAKQLKSYLLFFDQILANYMKHLQSVKELLSVNAPLGPTVFAQQVADMPNIETLVEDAKYKDLDTEELGAWLYGELENRKIKTAAILDHLLARFAENFGSYTFLMKQLYGEAAHDQVIFTKKTFLKEYADQSYHRGLGFKYCCIKENLWNNSNVSYFEKRIGSLIGMTNISRRNLSSDILEIYSESTPSGVAQLRWRMRNTKGEIIKTATKYYKTEEDMYTEIFLVKHLGVDEMNYEIREAENNKFYIVLVDRKQDPKSEAYVIARKYSYFSKKENAEKMVKKVVAEIQASNSNEGMFLIENVLLLPNFNSKKPDKDHFLPVCAENCESCEELDPYSYRVTIVLPGWTERFFNMDFRNYLENLIRHELPAHVMARICWIGHPDFEDVEVNDMEVFEKAYREFLEQKATTKDCVTKADNKLTNLINAINELNSIYPKGSLIDCDYESDEIKGKVILGRTQI